VFLLAHLHVQVPPCAIIFGPHVTLLPVLLLLLLLLLLS
jgi:hypothetical protein